MGQNFKFGAMDEGKKRIILWIQEAQAAGMAREEVRGYVLVMNQLYEAQKKAEAISKRQRENVAAAVVDEAERRKNAIAALRERGQALAARMNLARGLIAQQIRGGDGADLQLPGAHGAGSAQAYSAMVRSRMQKTGKKTEEEMLDAVRKQLDEAKELNKKADRMLQKLDIGAMEMF